MVTVLLDSNLLIALAVGDHVHHDAAEAWFAALAEPHATCPITQGALIRLVLRLGGTPSAAASVLRGIASHRRHEFWPDSIGFDAVSLAGIVGHRQVTDAYLAGLARHMGGSIATFDTGLAGMHPDVAVLVPAAPSN